MKILLNLTLIDLHNFVIPKGNYVAFLVLCFINISYYEFCLHYHCEQMHIDGIRSVFLNFAVSLINEITFNFVQNQIFTSLEKYTFPSLELRLIPQSFIPLLNFLKYYTMCREFYS